jgi:hypothetical protein
MIPLVRPHCQAAADVHRKAGAQINRLRAPIKPCIHLIPSPARAVNAAWWSCVYWSSVSPYAPIAHDTLCCAKWTSERGECISRHTQSAIRGAGMRNGNR